MTTQEMMNIALALAGLNEMPLDTFLQVESDHVRRVLAGIDMGVAEIAIAHQLGYDCIARHHPNDARMAYVGKMEEQVHIAHMARFGVPLTIAQKVWAGREKLTFQNTHVQNYAAATQAARLLGIASMSIHTPADLIVQRAVQGRLDALSESKPEATVRDILDNLMEIREYHSTPQRPAVFVGDETSYAGKIMVSMAGGCAPTLEEYLACVGAGINTFVTMHIKREIQEALTADKRCNVVVAGHMASDSYGFNRILDAWEAKGIEVTRIGGIV